MNEGGLNEDVVVTVGVMGVTGTAAAAVTAAAAAAAEKARSRLSRCGACENCNRRDCGQCVNCVDKPKFGGPGIKKQACIARKCLNMQAREETADGGGGDEQQVQAVRKRAKATHPPSVPAALSFTTGDDVDLAADGLGKGSRSHSDENHSESADIDTDEAAEGELSTPKEQKESILAGNTEVLLEYLVRRKGRTEGWKRLRETDVEDAKTLDVGGDWPWADKTALEEEFISMNDRHRRESNTMPNLNVLAH